MTAETPAVEREFVIRAQLDFEYQVKAADADEAAQLMMEGEREIGPGDCVGYSVHSVVAAEAAKKSQLWDDVQDERTYCVCGHLVDSHFGRRLRDAKGDFVKGAVGRFKGRFLRDQENPAACGEHCDCLSPRTVATAGGAE